MTPRDLLARMQGAAFTAAHVAPSGDLTLRFGGWTILATGAWRILDAATLKSGRADPDAAARVDALRLGALQGFQPLSNFDIAIRAADRWMIEIYTLGAAATETCVITGPGPVRAIWTARGDFEIAHGS